MKKIKIIVPTILIFALSGNLFSQSWNNMNGGFVGDSSSTPTIPGVRSIIRFQGKIIATGTFAQAGSTMVNNIAEWDGNQWQPMGVGLWGLSPYPDAQGITLIAYHNALFVTGSFDGAGGAFHSDTFHIVRSIAKWDTTDWFKVSPSHFSGFNSIATASIEYHNNLYIGGGFSVAIDTAGIHPAQGIARWNDTVFSACGTLWSNNSSGNFHPRTGVVYNNKLIIGGFFNSINGSAYGTYGYVGAWDDTNWSTLSTGLNNSVFALTVFNGELYAGGAFTATGSGSPIKYVSKWDGTQWLPVGEGLNDTVITLCVDSLHNKLYAGGSFTQTGLGVSAKHLAEWTGTNWVEVGGGT